MSYTGVPAFQNDYYQNLLQQAYNTAQQPYQVSPVPGVAGINDWQQQSLDLASGGVGAWQPYYDQSQNALDQAGNFTQFAGNASVYDPNVMLQHLNPMLEGSQQEIARLANQNFQNSTMPSLNSNFGMAGQFGSARHEDAMTHAAQLNQQAISGAQATASNAAYNNAANDYLGWGQLGAQSGTNAANASNQIATGWQAMGAGAQQRNTNDIGNLTQAGGVVGTNEQNNLNWANQQFNQQQAWPWTQIQNMTAAMGNGQQFSTNGAATGPSNVSSNTNPYAGALTQFATGG
jgi:hypothetical protein